jgi:hypothetical protein
LISVLLISDGLDLQQLRPASTAFSVSLAELKTPRSEFLLTAKACSRWLALITCLEQVVGLKIPRLKIKSRKLIEINKIYPMSSI